MIIRWNFLLVPSRRPWFVFGILAITLAGCSQSPGLSTVTGEVKLPDGRPVPMGSVRFISQTPGNPFRTGTIENGRYTVEALQGENVVVVETPPAPEDGSNAKMYVTIPDKYTDPAQSDLRPDVNGPTFTFDIIMKR